MLVFLNKLKLLIMKNFCIRNFKQVKTTVLGLLFIAAAIVALLKFEALNIYIFFGLLGAGVLLLFSPDTLIDSLISFVTKNKDHKIDKDVNP